MTGTSTHQKGVTLVELIIVLAISTFIIGTTVSIFMSLLQAQKKVVQEQELLSQISYAADYIASLAKEAKRDTSGSCLGVMHSGDNYLLNHLDSAHGFYQGITFMTKDGICQAFFLDDDGALKEAKDNGPWQLILSDEFNVHYARFIINGDKNLQSATGNDSRQARVTFVLSTQLKSGTGQHRIIQTTVSQRNLNIQ